MKLLTSILLLAFIANSFADECNCRIRTNNRIINGEISKAHSMPWYVALISGNPASFYCGGSILNKKYILTTATCVASKKEKDISVVVDFKGFNEIVKPNQIYKVKKIYSQKNDDPREPGDIAILELKKEISFVKDEIEKGCFNLEKKEYTEPMLAIGFGPSKQPYKREGGKLLFQGKGDVLRQAFLTPFNCEDYVICLKPTEKNQTICGGDMGGPVHYTQNGETTIEGVGSFTNVVKKDGISYDCGGMSIFSRLSYYADWISEIADFDFCGSGPKTKPKFKKPEKNFFGLF